MHTRRLVDNHNVLVFVDHFQLLLADVISYQWDSSES
jgi:hypothetical protein